MTTEIDLPLDGVDGTTQYLDLSGKLWSSGGAVAPVMTTSTCAKGGASLVTDGTNWIDTPDHAGFDMGVSDFTLEFAIKFLSGSGYNIMGQCNASGNLGTTAGSWWVDWNSYYVPPIGGIRLNGRSASVAGYSFTGIPISIAALTENWNHFAFSRVSGNVHSYRNGVFLQSSTYMGGDIATDTSKFAIGRVGEVASSNFKGYIDCVKFVQGVGLYTPSNPPISPILEPVNKIIILGE